MYINILDFSKSLSYDDLERDLYTFFDENIIMYRLTSGIEGIKVSSENVPNRALYRISVTDAKNHKPQEIGEYLKMSLMSIYGYTYKPIVEYDNNDILIMFEKSNNQ